ncbi:MAG: hypothetical protein R2688_03545 [Fimbriimonadaceae bacterium]
MITLTSLLAATVLNTAQADAPTVSLTLNSPEAEAGQLVPGTVTVTFAPGLHGYQNPPSEDYMIPVAVSAGSEASKVLLISYPDGVPATVGGETKPAMTYEGTVEIPVLVRIPSEAGEQIVSVMKPGGISEMNESACFPDAQSRSAGDGQG